MFHATLLKTLNESIKQTNSQTIKLISKHNHQHQNQTQNPNKQTTKYREPTFKQTTKTNKIKTTPKEYHNTIIQQQTGSKYQSNKQINKPPN